MGVIRSDGIKLSKGKFFLDVGIYITARSTVPVVVPFTWLN